MPAFRDGAPTYNPFIGSYAYRETCFESGPSEPNRASKGQKDAWTLDDQSEDNIDNGEKTAANFPDGAMAEASEATATRHGSDVATRGIESEDRDADWKSDRFAGEADIGDTLKAPIVM